MTAATLEVKVAWIALTLLAPVCLIALAAVWRQHRRDGDHVRRIVAAARKETSQ